MSNETYNERLHELVNALADTTKIDEIVDAVSKKPGVSISLCIPKEDPKKENSSKKSIHLLIESPEQIGFLKLAELTSPVKEIIGYDYSSDDDDFEGIVTIHLKDPLTPKVDEKFSNIIRFSKDNQPAIRQFLVNHFPDAFKENDLEALGERIARQDIFREKTDDDVVDFLVNIMSSATRCGHDARKLLQETETKLSALRVSSSNKK